MKARNVIFVIVVLAILGIIVYSQMADQKVCALTGIKAGDYKKSILDNLEMGNEDDAIVSYMEFTSCFGERKSEALQFMVEHYKDLFSDWQQKDMDLEVVSKYKLIKSRVDEPLFERNLEEQVFKSYFNMLSPLEDKIDMLNFVTNTTSAECNRYIPLYEDIKSTIKNTEVRYGIYNVQTTAQKCYVIRGNMYRFNVMASQDVDNALENYKKATEIIIETPVYNHAKKLIEELSSCSEQAGRCLPRSLKADCKEIIGPSMGWECNPAQICCQALI